MAHFNYKARNGQGDLSTGVLQASGLEEAGQMLRAEGKFVVELKPAAHGAEVQPVDVKKRIRHVKREEVITFAHQLAVMVDTGVPLKEALDCALAQNENEAFRVVLRDVAEQVGAGCEFSTAMARFPTVFPSVMVSLVRASEISGTMGEMLDRISSYLTKENQTRKRVKSALTYPAFMIVMAVCVTVFLLLFVLPKFARIYEGRGATLPAPTRLLMGASAILIHYWYAWIALALTVGVAGWFFLQTDVGRRTADYLKLHTPILRNLFLKLYLTRACRTMGTMVSTGVAMLDMIAIVRRVTENVYFQELWDEVDDRLRKGAQLSEPLFESPLFPRAITQMIYSGERSGRLGMVMTRVAQFTEEEFDDAVKTTTQFIEPVMVAVMGAVVGFIAIAMLLPIFSVGRVVAGG